MSTYGWEEVVELILEAYLRKFPQVSL